MPRLSKKTFLLVGFFWFSATWAEDHQSLDVGALRRKVDACLMPVRTLGQFITPQPGVIHFPYESSFTIASPPRKTKVGRIAAKTVRALHEMGGALEFFFSPLPVRFVKGPTTPIFQKLWADSKYHPTPQERSTLEKYRADKVFDERQKFIQKWPKWVKFQRSLVWARRIALTASLILAMNHGFQVGAHTVSQKEFLEGPKFALQSNQVQLINEVVPFPHTSLRIGEKVYSYGYTHLSVKTPSEYFASRRDWEGAFVQEAREGSSSAHPVQAMTEVLGALPRSVQVITLNLNQTERDRLKRDMELATGNRYYNVTFVNDCTTMIFRAIERNTSIRLNRLIDASPSQMALYFSALKSGADSRLGPVYQVSIDDSSFHFLRNLYINSLESKIFIDLFVYNQAHRVYVDLFKSATDLQYREPAVETVIQKIKSDIAKRIAQDPQILKFRELAIEPSEEFRAIVTDYFDQKIQRATEKYLDPESDFKDIIENEKLVEVLTDERDSILSGLTKTSR